ncbi:hypothetical protein E2C01_051395 [Portunus trituberculatus]|uniref:Uncharacterized protein n=1 Tax=Portunus trituberculatus TaxID=210409 RepID=A0A5B7GIL3_PORTR|nr:hypothetical protein [Portunus trituberculatus]
MPDYQATRNQVTRSQVLIQILRYNHQLQNLVQGLKVVKTQAINLRTFIDPS